MFGGDDPESIPSYWRDITYGELDLVAGTEVTPLLTIPHKRSEAVGSGTNDEKRGRLTAWVKEAGSAFGVDFGRFFGFVAFFASGFDLFGSAGDPHVVCHVDSIPAEIHQEYGHAYGLDHSRAVLVPEDYKNPFCIMSGLTFGDASGGSPGIPKFAGVDPTFPSKFGPSGPGLCSPYLSKAGWLPESRVIRIANNGAHPQSQVISLSPLGKMAAAHPQVAIVELNAPQPIQYFIEYRRGGWDRMLLQEPVVIHQLRPDGYAYYAGDIGTVPKSGAAGGPALPPGRWYVDPVYDLSVELLATQNDQEMVVLRVAPASAARALSVRTIAQQKLGLAGTVSVGQVLGRPGSVRARMAELLGA